MCEAKFNESEKKWIREDKLECLGCGNTYSTNSELFKVEFIDGENKDSDGKDYVYCCICLGEYPLSNEPENIKQITRVR